MQKSQRELKHKYPHLIVILWLSEQTRKWTLTIFVIICFPFSPVRALQVIGGEFERIMHSCAPASSIYSFDMHKECAGRMFDRLYQLVESVEPHMRDYSYTLLSTSSVCVCVCVCVCVPAHYLSCAQLSSAALFFCLC